MYVAQGWLPGEGGFLVDWSFGGENSRNKAVGVGKCRGLLGNHGVCGPGEESMGVDPPSSSWVWGRIMAPEDVHVLTQPANLLTST